MSQRYGELSLVLIEQTSGSYKLRFNAKITCLPTSIFCPRAFHCTMSVQLAIIQWLLVLSSLLTLNPFSSVETEYGCAVANLFSEKSVTRFIATPPFQDQTTATTISTHSNLQCFSFSQRLFTEKRIAVARRVTVSSQISIVNDALISIHTIVVTF